MWTCENHEDGSGMIDFGETLVQGRFHVPSFRLLPKLQQQWVFGYLKVGWGVCRWVAQGHLFSNHKAHGLKWQIKSASLLCEKDYISYLIQENNEKNRGFGTQGIWIGIFTVWLIKLWSCHVPEFLMYSSHDRNTRILIFLNVNGVVVRSN